MCPELRHPRLITHLVSLGGSAAPQQGQVDSVFFPGVIEAVRQGGMEEFCSRQGLGPEGDSRRGRATRQAFLAADHLAMAALLAATDATTGIPDEELAACQVPALWMAGPGGRRRLEQYQRAARLVPDVRFVALPGRVHGSTLSPPDEVLEQVLPFLR